MGHCNLKMSDNCYGCPYYGNGDVEGCKLTIAFHKKHQNHTDEEYGRGNAMTQEEKAKAYDEALERAKNLHKDAIDMGENIRAKQCEIIFPELAESEDEKMREELIRSFKSLNTIEIWNGIKRSDILAWLEKQQGGKDKFTQQHSLKEDSNVNDETNAPTEYGKYVDECLNEASKHFFSEGEDKYSVADLFYAGVRCGKSWLEKQEQKPATIDIDRMVDDYANNKERE